MAMTFMERYYQEGFQIGFQRGFRKSGIKAITTLLTTRFGVIPVSLKKKIQGVSDIEHLEALVQVAVKCDDLNGFKKALKQV